MDAIKSLLSRKSITLFFIIQVIISMNGIMFNLMRNGSLIEYKSKVSSINEKNMFIRNNEEYLTGPNAIEERKLNIISLEEYLNNNNEILNWGVSSHLKIGLSKDELSNLNIRNDSADKLIKKFGDKSSDININLRFINEGYNNILNYNIIQGEKLEAKDFEDEIQGEPLPVILGYKFKGIYEVGDIIPFKDRIGSDLKVKGIRAQGGYFYKYVEEGKAAITEEDYFITCVLPKDYKEDYILNYQLFRDGILMELKDSANIDSIDQDINLLFLDGITSNAENIAKNHINSEIRDTNRKAFFDIILIIICVVSLSTVMSILIRKRKGEFGIRFATGYTKKSLCKLVLKENSIVIFISAIINIFLYYENHVKIYSEGRWQGVNSVLNTNMDIGVLGVLKVTLIIFIITTLISIIGIYKIKSMNVVELIKED